MAAGIGSGNAVARDVRLAERLIEQGAEVPAESSRTPASGSSRLLARG